MLRRLCPLYAVIVLSTGMIVAQSDTLRIAPGESIQGSTEEEIVEVLFDMQAGATAGFTIMADFNAVLSVRDDDNTLLATNEDFAVGDVAPLLFIAPENGTYALTIDGAFSVPTGTYTVAMMPITPIVLNFDTPQDIQPTGEAFVFFVFEGQAGAVIDLYAFAESDDSLLRVKLPDGEEVAADDDSGPGINPFIRRFTLPEDSRYIVQLEGFRANPLTEEITVTLNRSRRLPLRRSPREITLGGLEAGSSDVEIFTTGEIDADVDFELRIEAAAAEQPLEILVEQAGQLVTSFYFANFERVNLAFLVPEEGELTITLSLDYSTGATFFVSGGALDDD